MGLRRRISPHSNFSIILKSGNVKQLSLPDHTRLARFETTSVATTVDRLIPHKQDTDAIDIL